MLCQVKAAYDLIMMRGHGPQVPATDNYFAALNSAVFSDGSFVYVPKGVISPMEVSTYFRINAEDTGQVGPYPHTAAEIQRICLLDLYGTTIPLVLKSCPWRLHVRRVAHLLPGNTTCTRAKVAGHCLCKKIVFF
jgi:hypothetical protein